jgi:hypothetical protein
MRYTSDDQRRYAFRDWLRAELARLEFYQRRGDRYLVSEFARYADHLGARVEEVSLGRYLRDENPVLPTPESCRELARALERHPAEVLLEAGYLIPEDFYYMPSPAVDATELRRQLREIDRYEYLPEAIRAQMKAAIERQIQQAERPGRPHKPAQPQPAHADVSAALVEQPAPRHRVQSGSLRDSHKGS